jgi:hypothetical protein
MIRRLFFILIVSIGLTGCQSPGGIPSPVPEDPDSAIESTVIYIIHGDADYTFHQNGTLKQADEEVLAEARRVGKQTVSGEVFIFHLQPRSGIKNLVSNNHRHLDYFRNGKLLVSANYKPQITRGTFSSEVELFNSLSAGSSSQNLKKVLLYFGHEIPPKDGDGYHQSYPQATFNYRTFVQGINGFTENRTCDLIVMSTCNNGTPLMVNLLKNRTRYLLASPQNLHLSHMDSESLTLLENRETSLRHVAESMAESTFRRLTESIQTAVTLSLYDMRKVESYLPELSEGYSSYLHGSGFRVGDDNIDCTSLPFFKAGQYTAGVQLWYRPARFGENKAKLSHSGWGCQQAN